MNSLSRPNGRAEPDVDRLLHEFFLAELPDPWPRSPVPRPAARPPLARRPRHFARYALAASLVLALAGYWAIAGLFPAASAPSLSPLPNGPTVGEKAGHRDP